MLWVWQCFKTCGNKDGGKKKRKAIFKVCFFWLWTQIWPRSQRYFCVNSFFFAEEQGACRSSSIPTQGEAYSHGIMFQKISSTETATCWLPSAFWGNSKRMFQMPWFYKIHVISCRAWLADKNRLVNKPTGNLDGSCQRYCRASVALGLLSVSVLDTYTRHWEPLVSCLAGFALGHNRPFYLVTLMYVCICVWGRKTENKRGRKPVRRKEDQY